MKNYVIKLFFYCHLQRAIVIEHEGQKILKLFQLHIKVNIKDYNIYSEQVKQIHLKMKLFSHTRNT